MSRPMRDWHALCDKIVWHECNAILKVVLEIINLYEINFKHEGLTLRCGLALS